MDTSIKNNKMDLKVLFSTLWIVIMINVAMADIFGLLFGLSYGLTGRIAIAIDLHTTWNLFQGNVFGFPVSGETFPLESASVFSIQQKGPALWTGGAFGPEAGLVGLITFAIGFLILISWVRFRQGCLKLDLQLAQPPQTNRVKLNKGSNREIS